MINEASPIFFLDALGAIAFIDNALYLIIEGKVMSSYSQVQPMVDLDEYFLRPECYRLNFHYLSKMERHVMDFFASYLKEIINTNHYIYLTVLDMHRLGKLVVSKNNIEYFNGLHHWKYTIRRNVVQLPTLLAAAVKTQGNQEKMARKLSLSVKKFTSDSNKKQGKKEKDVKLQRPQSASKLKGALNKNLSSHQEILVHNNRLATENYEKRAKSRTKSEVEKLKIYEKSSIPSKTEPNNVKTQPSDERQKSQAKSFRRKSTSRQKLSLSRAKKIEQNTQYNEKKVNVQLQSSKKKLSLQQPKQSRVPILRQRLAEQAQQFSQNQIMISQFVVRSTSKVIQQPQLQGVQPNKIKEYLHQLTSIYMQKQAKVRQNRENKTRLYAQQAKASKATKRTQHIHLKDLEQSLRLSETDYKIFNHCFDLIQKYQNLFTKETSAYIVCYKEHSNIIQALINKFNNSINTHKLNKRTMILVALQFHEFLHFVKETQISMLGRIISHSKKVISINILKQSSFREDIMDFVHKFQAIFTPLVEYLRLNFPKPLWIQQYQVQSLKTAKSTLHSFLVQHTSSIQANFLKFRTANCKSILSTTYHTQKQGLALIKKLDQLKYTLDNQLQFKSELYFPGICYNINEVKEQYLILISQKYYDIYTYFYKVYEKSQSELNNKLKTIIVINVDYLSDYKCREYRDQIEEHYKNLLESLMLIIDHFYYLFKESEFNAFLAVAYDFKAQINHNLLNFNNKLQQYRNNSNKTIKMLEVKSKENKEVYQELTQKLKKLLATLNSQRAILEFKQQIMHLDQQFIVYSQNNSKLVQSMKENQMVYWQDDQFFISNITLLKSSLEFLEGKNYKVFFSLSIGQLTINQFYAAFEQFSAFMGKLIDTKIEKLFRPTFTLIQSNLVLVEIVLYKDYTQFQLQKSKEIGIDISSQKNSKIFTTIKRYQNLQKKKFQQMVELYRQSRLNQFNLYHDESLSTLKVQKVRGTYELQYIHNMPQLKLFLQQHNNIKASYLLSTLLKLQELYKEILIFNKMIYLISQTTLSDTHKDALLHNYNKQYESLLSLSSTEFQIQKFRNRLQEDKLKYMQIYYHQRVNVFTRFALCSIQELIDLNEWQNNIQITRNIKYIFNCVDDVTFDAQGNILSFQIDKDCLLFNKPFNIFQKQGEIAKSIYLHTQNFLRNSVSHSQYACIYIKLLIWHIYFTQQVQLCFMTESSLQRVKDNFLQLIKEIANQIRYDIKLHYKSYEIAQLNYFISHLDKIKNTCLITDFQWVSTIRYYEKLKIVKVEQNDRVHDYSFQIKRPMNYDPSFQLQTNISYGFKQSSLYYEISAYILGKPFVTFLTLSHYGFQANYSVLMNFIKKYEYFVCIVVSPDNFKSINYFHKKILQLSLKKLGSIEQETLNMPVFFQYPCEAALPLCFPQKYRNFSNPQFSYDLNLIILLQLNKYQQVFDRSKINVQVLVNVLNIINVKKNLTLKKTTSFIESLSAFLVEDPEKLEIQTFCYKYFIVNYQLDDHMVAGMLDELIQDNQDGIIILMKEQQAIINDFIKKDKQEMIIYGPTSFKSKLVKEMKIPSYYDQSNLHICHIEGLQEYLSFKKSSPLIEKKVIIQDRFIHHIDPAMLSEAVLHYSGELTTSNVQLIFKSKIMEMQLDGNSQLLWLKFQSFYNIFAQISGQHISFLGMTELVLRCYQSHILDFLDQLEKEEKEFYKLNINKETIRAFLVISHEIFYYLLSLDQRKKFTEKLKALPFMEEFRSQQLHSMTCNGLNCDKLVNLAKKEKVTFRNIGNYTKQFIIIKKYLRYQQPIALYCSSKITAKLLKQQIQSLDYSKISITLNERYIDILRISKYSNILYVVNDLHLQQKQNLTFLKVRQELASTRLSYYLMLTQDHTYRKAMKNCVGFRFSDLQMEEIYRFQNKEGIADTVQIKCKNIWNDGFFANQPTFLMFLINVSVKLPSQYFKKFFARQMILTKFTPTALAIETIQQNEEMIRRIADVTSTNAYLLEYRGHHQEITDTQITKRIEKLMASLTFVQRIIVKDYYKQILPYSLSDKLYIIKEDIPVLPLIITHMQQRKYFKIQNKNFLTELIEVIEEVYNNQKECTLIVEEPLSSSQEWGQFMSNYLKGIDLINLYSELREYTQLLASKQQYVFRLQDQAIPLKDKVSQILYEKIKIIVSQTVLSSLPINTDQLYINNIVYLNCSLTVPHKQGITRSIIKKMLQESRPQVSAVFSPFQPYILLLIRSDLLFINRMEQFLNDIIATIRQELEQISRFKEVMTIKKKLFYNLATISQAIQREFNEIGAKENENKTFLGGILEVVNSCENEGEQYVEMYSYESLIKLRDEFACNQRRNAIWMKGNLQYERVYQVLQQLCFQNCLKCQYGAAMFTLTSEAFLQILNNPAIFQKLQQLYTDQFAKQESKSFILLRYVKFVLDLTQIYRTINYSPQLIAYQIRKLNYYYLLDICVQLKAKEQIILREFDDLSHRKRLIDDFTSILREVQHIDIQQQQLFHYHIFNRIKKIIRSYAIQAHQYPLMDILNQYDSQFLTISSNFEQYLLKETQTSFDSCNKSILTEQKNMIIYDPHNKLQAICYYLSIKIIYVNSQQDIEQLYDYKFKMTVFCIKLQNMQDFYHNRNMIANCLAIISKKHTDLKENILEKLVISIDQREILAEIKQEFAVINLGYSFIKFTQELERRMFDEQYSWSRRKEEYLDSKRKLRAEIELIKTLNPQEISLYIIKLEALIRNFQHHHQSIKKISTIVLFKQNDIIVLESLFKMMIKLHNKIEFPMNLSLRLLKNINIQDLIPKWQAVSSSPQKQQQDWLKNILLNSRSQQISEQILACIAQSRYIAIIYQQFNKKSIKEVMQLQQSKKYTVRTIIQLNHDQLKEFISCSSLDNREIKEIVLFFVKFHEIGKLSKIINKCSVLWI